MYFTLFSCCSARDVLATSCLLFLITTSLEAQTFEYIEMDIGRLHHTYSDIGGLFEATSGMHWPAELAGSNSLRDEAFWLGVKNWTSPDSIAFDYAVTRSGPRRQSQEVQTVFPVSARLVSKWKRPEVTINGIANPGTGSQNDTYEIDPSLPADHMIHHVFRTDLGAEVDRKVYAFVNQFHDDYHITVRTITNTGNVDDDNDIELPEQTLNELMVFNSWRWTGREEAGFAGSNAQRWGKFNMVDIVGDGNENYEVDFTAIYSWAGYDPRSFFDWNNLGSPALSTINTTYPDTSGRLTGMSMQGLVVLHADASSSDASYDPLVQPRTLGWMDRDDVLTVNGQPLRDYYELGILTRENPLVVSGGSSRMYPHYADRVVPDGDFDTSVMDASFGRQGGHAPTVAYGPYQLGPGEDIRIVEALASGGLSLDAAKEIGEAYKASGLNENILIEYDANNDGMIDRTPFDFSVYNNGSEAQTKNQWYLSSKDSLLMTMERALDVWAASSEMTSYPVAEAPALPERFTVTPLPDRIELSWESQAGSIDPVTWEIYRTDSLFTNAPYELIAELDGGDRTYIDTEVKPFYSYYYYIQAVGAAQADDPSALNGTPGGVPLRSSRYLTQTKVAAILHEPVEVPSFVQVLQKDEEIFDDYFGGRVSLSGDYAVISAPGDDTFGSDNGTVYVFERQPDGSWVQDARIYIPTPDRLGRPEQQRGFGSSILLANDQLFIRDPLDNEAVERGGTFYVYMRNEMGEWVETGKVLTGPPETQFVGNQLGAQIAVEEDILITTSTRTGGQGGVGAVYAFKQQDDGSWIQEHVFFLERPELGTLRFGHTIALQLPYVFVCAELTGVNTGEYVYVFERLEDGTWVERQLLSSGNEAGELFAFDLAVTGNQLLAGAPLTPASSADPLEGDVLDGAVYVYEQQPSDSTWELHQVLRMPTAIGGRGNFGGTIDAEGDRAIILGGETVALYGRDSDGMWSLRREIRNIGNYEREFRAFGISLDLDGDYALVGAPSTTSFVDGSGYVFDLTSITYTSVDDPEKEGSEVPSSFILEQNYPNPFNPATTIEYEVPEAVNVKIVVYNALGKRVKTLVDGVHSPGRYDVVFDSSNLASGAYFYQLETPTKRLTRSMMLLK